MRVDGVSTNLLPAKVQLFDIEDAEGFVAAAIRKSKIRLTPFEHEELLAEGLTILYDLASKFEPHRAGYSQPGRFSGYAAQFLPRKLGDAWHSMMGHRLVTGPDGVRRWELYARPDSIDDEDSPLEIAAPAEWSDDEHLAAIEELVGDADGPDRALLRRVVRARAEGFGWHELAADPWGLSLAQIAWARDNLEKAIERMQGDGDREGQADPDDAHRLERVRRSVPSAVA